MIIVVWYHTGYSRMNVPSNSITMLFKLVTAYIKFFMYHFIPSSMNLEERIEKYKTSSTFRAKEKAKKLWKKWKVIPITAFIALGINACYYDLPDLLLAERNRVRQCYNEARKNVEEYGTEFETVNGVNYVKKDFGYMENLSVLMFYEDRLEKARKNFKNNYIMGLGAAYIFLLAYGNYKKRRESLADFLEAPLIENRDIASVAFGGISAYVFYKLLDDSPFSFSKLLNLGISEHLKLGVRMA